MKLYDFLEELLFQGGKIEDIEILTVAPEVGSETLEHTGRLIQEYLAKNEAARGYFKGTRRFGFDRGSYIGDLKVSEVRRKASLSTGKVIVCLSKPI